MSSRLFPAAVAGLLFALHATPAAAADPVTPAAKTYDDPALERIRKDIFFLASPECEGRGVETKGIEKAADYVVEAFKQAGLKPAMKDGSYFQPFTITASAKLGGVPTLALTNPAGTARDLEAGTDFNAMGYSPTSRAAGGLVFVGYGITAPDLKYDDYAGLDVAGKVVVMLRRTPRYGTSGEKRFDTTVPTGDGSPHAPFDAKIENAVAHKAAGIILVNDATAAGKADPLPQFANHATGTTPAPFPVLFVKRDVADSFLASGPVKSVADIETLIDGDLKPRSFEVKGWKAAAEVAVTRVEYKPKNIVGVLDGAGPLADETVVIGGHYDHIGLGGFGSMAKPADRGSKIHFGADDNASGTSAVIELARRYGAVKDRQGRRLVFIAFSGEERGLIGSMYYCKNPVFPLDKTAGMINLDMVGRVRADDWLQIWGPSPDDRLQVYGTGTGADFSKLVKGTAEKVPFRLTLNESASLGGAGGSDHESFYMKRVPVLFLFSGFHPQYHSPTDVPERINVPGVKKVVDFSQQLADHLLTVTPRPEYRVVKAPATATPAGPKGPRMGVVPDYNFMEETGMLLQAVSPGGPAEKGGLKDGDLIVEIAGKPVKNVTGYMTVMGAQKSGTAIDVVVMRKGQKMTIKVTPE